MPVFAHGQLRLYLLALLESGPKHGYELITALSDRFGGTYRPSPGTVYPRLARMEEEGLVRRVDDGRKGTYALTDAGLAELAARRGDLAALEENLAETVRALAVQVRDEVRGAMAGLRADLAAAAQEARASAAPAPPVYEYRAGYEHRASSRALRADIEGMLQRFRDEVRADVRRADVQGEISQLTVDTVRTVLDSARTAIRATLPGHR
jgi:DNA-binding PadR family transcriptional regulator